MNWEEHYICILIVLSLVVTWYKSERSQQKKIDKLHELAANMTEKYYDAQATIKRLKSEKKAYSEISKAPYKDVLITTGGTGGLLTAIVSIEGDFDLEVGDRFTCNINTESEFIRAHGYVKEEYTYLLPYDPQQSIPALVKHKAFVCKL